MKRASAALFLAALGLAMGGSVVWGAGEGGSRVATEPPWTYWAKPIKIGDTSRCVLMSERPGQWRLLVVRSMSGNSCSAKVPQSAQSRAIIAWNGDGSSGNTHCAYSDNVAYSALKEAVSKLTKKLPEQYERAFSAFDSMQEDKKSGGAAYDDFIALVEATLRCREFSNAKEEGGVDASNHFSQPIAATSSPAPAEPASPERLVRIETALAGLKSQLTTMEGSLNRAAQDLGKGLKTQPLDLWPYAAAASAVLVFVGLAGLLVHWRLARRFDGCIENIDRLFARLAALPAPGTRSATEIRKEGAGPELSAAINELREATRDLRLFRETRPLPASDPVQEHLIWLRSEMPEPALDGLLAKARAGDVRGALAGIRDVWADALARGESVRRREATLALLKEVAVEIKRLVQKAVSYGGEQQAWQQQLNLKDEALALFAHEVAEEADVKRLFSLLRSEQAPAREYRKALRTLWEVLAVCEPRANADPRWAALGLVAVHRALAEARPFFAASGSERGLAEAELKDLLCRRWDGLLSPLFLGNALAQACFAPTDDQDWLGPVKAVLAATVARLRQLMAHIGMQPDSIALLVPRSACPGHETATSVTAVLPRPLSESEQFRRAVERAAPPGGEEVAVYVYQWGVRGCGAPRPTVLVFSSAPRLARSLVPA